MGLSKEIGENLHFCNNKLMLIKGVLDVVKRKELKRGEQCNHDLVEMIKEGLVAYELLKERIDTTQKIAQQED